MRTMIILLGVSLSVSSALAQQPQNQTVAVGSWNIATTYKAEKFDNCTMSRTIADLGASFVRTEDGLLLILDSPKWKLERGKAYSVRLTAGSQSVDAKALAESKGVTIALADRPFNGRLRSVVSSGCIRMLNADVIDLYNRVSVGTKIVVMPSGKDVPKMVARVAAAPRLAVNTPANY